MSSGEEVVLEHTRKVMAITDSCSSNEHSCIQQCADDAGKAKYELKQANEQSFWRLSSDFPKGHYFPFKS